MQFEAHIGLGNAAMQTGGDVANALRDLADRIELHDELTTDLAVMRVRDRNGNRVGYAAVTTDGGA